MRQLLLLLLLCSTLTGFAQHYKDTTIIYNGNTLLLSTRGKVDTQVMTKMNGDNAGSIYRRDPLPVLLNNEPVHRTYELTTQPEVERPLAEFVFAALAHYLPLLPDDTYRLHITDIVIDKKGKVAYHSGTGLSPYIAGQTEAIMQKVEDVLSATPAFTPGKLNDKEVAVLTDIFLNAYEITVSSGHVRIQKQWNNKPLYH